jgi:hypothetical protein
MALVRKRHEDSRVHGDGHSWIRNVEVFSVSRIDPKRLKRFVVQFFFDFRSGHPYLATLPGKNPSSFRARTGCCNLRMAFASTCRTRSRVTLKIRPTSSSV